MKKIISFAVIALCLCSTAFAQRDWANFRRYNAANAQVTQTPKAVFMGDSIFDFWYNNDADFFNSHNFAARGIGGQTTSEMLVRMRQDVLKLQPKYMVFLGGINDIAQNNGYIAVENTFGNIVSILELAKLHKIKPILCLIFPGPSIGWNKNITDAPEKVEQLNAMLRDYAKANKIPLVEFFRDIDKSEGRLPKELSEDSIHPTMEGYKIMEKEIINYIK